MLFLSFLSFVILSQCAPAVPTWPKQFTAFAQFSLPYGYGINEPIYCAYDGVNNRAKMSYYYGMDTYIYRNDLNASYMVIPRVDVLTCFSNPGQQDLPTVLPDLTGWTFIGEANGVRTWQNNVTNLGHTSVYTMTTNATNDYPIQLTMEGYDFLFGSHPDIYILRFISFTPTTAAYDYDVPSLCNNARVNERLAARTKALTSILGSVVRATQPAHEFDSFLSLHKKSYSGDEYISRYNNWKTNNKLIEAHKHKGHSFTLKPNHFMDWTHEEFKNLMLPNSVKNQPRPRFEAKYVLPEPTPEQIAALPASVDWRQKGAVTMVKDQGVCGSCWTFGTTGSLEGCWAVKHGQLLSLSEQQIVDCAWTTDFGQGDSGCDGGFAAPAMQWIMDNNGIALQKDYKYLMVDGWCDASIKTSGVTVKGYVNVTEGSEAALQYAVATFGPVAVAIDAAHEEFEFYGSGVYYNPKCKNDMNDLDHEVLAVGYGTDENGNDYWIVKNSWSTHWGDDGYIKMARNRGNNCGIATQATYPLV